MQPPSAGIPRRSLFAAAPLFLPRHVLGGSGHKAPSDKLVLAGIGVGGVGKEYLKSCETETIGVICDVDDALAAPVFAHYPNARRYRDYRLMLEREKGIDGVVIGTPDHSHAAIALASMAAGKAVYCAKPLTRTITECRQVVQAARNSGVATQMSTQTSLSDPSCSTQEWIRAGVIGAVREVHVWTDRPVWPQGLERPREAPKVPKTLDWNLWLAAAPKRPYHPVYHPFRWRGWVDFGTGAMGDMACHAFHVVFRALDLGAPTAVSASSSFIQVPDYNPAPENWSKSRKVEHPETFPMASVVTWDFPALAGRPAVRMHWYEGGIKPPRPAALPAGRKFGGSGLLFVGDKGELLNGFTGGPELLGAPKDFVPPPKTLERTADHYQEWIAAAKGGKPASVEFSFGGLLTEVALTGVIAIRTGRHLEWESQAGQFTNDKEANALL